MLKKMFRSSEIIDKVLKSLGIEIKDISNYQDYTLPNGDLLRLRISDHGINLSTWHRKNKEAREVDPKVPKLDKSTNIAITFQPTKEECEEKGVAFPQKIINKTQVKTDSGNNVKPQFSVGHICYASWLLSKDEINLIIRAITNFVNNGIYCDPIGLDSGKVLAWNNTSNIPPQKLTTNTNTIKFSNKNNKQTNENKAMKKTIRLTESELHRIVKESVKKVLRESDADIDNDRYYGGGLSSKYFQDEEPNEIEDFEGQPSWDIIDSVLTQQGVNDIDVNTKITLIKQIAQPLVQLDKCMILASREIYKDVNGKQRLVSQDDIIKFVRESLPNYHTLLYSIKKLWIDYGWLIEKR